MEKLNNNLLQQKLTSLPFRKIAPNIVTTLALCAGVTSMRYAIMGLWGKAIVCIFLAALFDMLDGRVARMLKGSTKFGAELDSLSDFVSFGVAPAILMYQWTLSSFPKFGWFSVCCLPSAWRCVWRVSIPCWKMSRNRFTGRTFLSACRLRLRRRSEFCRLC